MKSFLSVFGVLSAAVLSGCFSHREAPVRPVTARSLEEATSRREDVQKLVLNGSTLQAIPADLASMPRLETLHIRDTKVVDFSGLASLGGLVELDLSGIKLPKAPDELEAPAL